MRSVTTTLFATLLSLSAGWAHAAPQLNNLPATDATQRQSVTALVRDRQGTQLGSAVVVGSAPGGYWFATNRHVVLDQPAVCVVTADRQALPALVIAAALDERRGELDLSLLWLPRSGATQPLSVAAIKKFSANAGELPVVTATGYPTPLQAKPDGPQYTENDGLLLPLLSQPLEGGFSLAYTAAVEKGMSGGGVFAGRDLIGINGAHANPLWPGQWKHPNGKAVNDQLNPKLELVALGIASPVIQQALLAARAPSALQLDALTEMRCRGYEPVPSGSPAKSKAW